jgi:DNA-binding CsgD family transcriptional regulator
MALRGRRGQRAQLRPAGPGAGHDEARLVGEDDQLRPVVRVELEHRAADVCLCSGRGHHEPLGSLVVAETVSHERHNLALAGGQLVDQLAALTRWHRPRGELGEKGTRESRRQDRLAAKEAVAGAVPSLEYPYDAFWVLPELVEAGSRSGDVERATAALDHLAGMTTPAGNAWGLGIEARCRALLTDGDAAEPLYRDAIDALGRTRIRVELARSHLLYGEWLRRQRRRREAREQLRIAHGMLDAIGARAFAERAARELQATGETARSRTAETRDELTPQEAQIARLARDGLSNPQIGAQLFISPRTVQYHLHKVFTKLGVSSRKELDLALAEAEGILRRQ